MAIKFVREIVVSSLAAALVTAVYTHGSDLNASNALSAASSATSVGKEDQRPEDLARFQAQIASAHVGKSSPPSPIVEAPAGDAASADSEPVWPPQEKGTAARPARAAVAGKAAALKPSPAAASAAATAAALPGAQAAEAPPPAQAEAAPASYASRIADKFKDYVWNPGASVVNGVSNGWSTMTNRITSFVKKQPS